ncbi:site-specific integrase [Chimaeribacter arupi]|uniref:site-specific integrase n=1 Tax=Chimaeribacter arupi TaxID=2060066 RepID=UPI000C79AA37|nr:site-specific integrase [Chimaeribacter arupi]PLR48675.1 site-specific integrase [Chimaeribacter arupi]
MVKQIDYPTGVENHGGTLRMWFIYKGQRVRENLGVPDTVKNRKVAGELRAAVCFAIKSGRFNYAEQFPNSPNLIRFGVTRQDITVGALASKWLAFKELDLTRNALKRYNSYISVASGILGNNTLLSSVTPEKILALRKELLTGYQICGIHQLNRNIKKGRTARTVNTYLSCVGAMFDFALQNGYVDSDPFARLKPLKKAKSEPDPLNREEYQRLLAIAPSEQIRNIWILAINTGMRHGEICALAWEDIDTKNWTIKVTRNLAVVGHFTPPKTESSVRVVNLTQPAITALRNQMALTKMGVQHNIEVHLREYGKTRQDLCTFVFVPRLSARNGQGGDWYSPGSIGSTWNNMLKRAGIPHRKSYESRHTYACWALSAGANPNYIANQMGHSSAQMLYSVYGKWMTDRNDSQLDILNASFSDNAPLMPQASNL